MKKKPKQLAKKKSAKKKIQLEPSGAALALALPSVGKRAMAGDEVSARLLWAAFNWLAGALAMMADQESCAVDMERLFNIAQRCEHMLREAVRRKDAAGLRIAFNVAAGGCEILKEATKQDLEFVASFAEGASTWPVLLACKKSFHDEADAYMESIRVGTKSVPRTTAGTKVSASSDVRTAELASMILRKLTFYRTILGRGAAGVRFPKGSTRTAEETSRIEAKEFKEILKLQPLTKETWQQWWKVGRLILEKDWASDAKQAAVDVNLIGGEGQTEYRLKPKPYAVKKIRLAFHTAAKAVFPLAPVLTQG